MKLAGGLVFVVLISLSVLFTLLSFVHALSRHDVTHAAECDVYGLNEAGSNCITTSSAINGNNHHNRGLRKERYGVVDRWLQGFVDRGEYAGLVMLIDRQGGNPSTFSNNNDESSGRYLKAVGWRDREAGVNMTTDTIFRVCSMTKPIVSVAFMTLVEDGFVGLQDQIKEWLPEFSNPQVIEECTPDLTDCTDGYHLVPAKRPITVEHLLTHTAGYGYGFYSNDDMPTRLGGREQEIFSEYHTKLGVLDGCTGGSIPLEENMKRLAGVPLISHPGDQMIYGMSTDILGRLIEVITKTTLREFLEEKIFLPLNMSDTSFHLYPESEPKDQERKDRLATLYYRAAFSDHKGFYLESARKQGIEPKYKDAESSYYQGPRTLLSGGCGLVSTAEDYGKFLRVLLSEGKAPDGTHILSRKTIEAMIKYNRLEQGDFPMKNLKAYARKGQGFGLGFGIGQSVPNEIFSPGISLWGGLHRTLFFVDPTENLFVVLLTQCHGFSAGCSAVAAQSRVFNVVSSLLE